MLIDPAVVAWDEYHTIILESVSNCRATNKHNSAIRSKKYIDYVEDAADRMKRSYPDSIAMTRGRGLSGRAALSLLRLTLSHALPLVSIIGE